MIAIKYVFVLALSYLLGSVSVSIVMSKAVMKLDVRLRGSGNAGATNMARVFGMRMGVLTLAGDMLKAALAMLAGWLLLGEWGLCVSGVACMLGHCYPVLHEFRGGKGVSVGAAIALAVDWRVFLIVILLFLLIAVLSRKVSLGSIFAALAGFCAAAFFALPLPRILLAAFAMLLIVLRHRENILRLIKGVEPDFKPGKAMRRMRKKPDADTAADGTE